MSSAKTIAKNTGFLFLSGIIEKIISFVLIIIIARYLGDVGMGKYSLAFAYVSVFIMFSDLGISTFMVREVAKDKTKTEKLFNNVFTLKIVLLLVSSILAVATIFLIPKFKDVISIVFLVIISQFLIKMLIPFRNVFTSHERMEYSSLILVTERVFALLLCFFAISQGYGLMGILIALIISALITLIVGYIILIKKFMKPAPEFDIHFWKHLIKNSLPFAFFAIFMVIYFRTDTIMLSLIKGYAVTGWYNAASKIIDALTFFGFYIVTATFPAMSKFHQTSKEKLKLLFKKTFYYLWVLAFPLAIGTTILADRIILFMYEGQFIHSGIILKILIWAEVFIFLNYSLGYLLNSTNKQKLFAISTGITAFMNIVLNLALIPKFSYIGASFATVITHGINFGFLYHFTSKEGFKLNLIKIMYKPVIAGLLMGITLIYLNSLHLLILIPIAVLVYFFSLTLIKGFEKEELHLIKSILRKN